MPYNPNSDLVGEKWFGGVPGLSPAMVATTLPRDPTTWTTIGGSAKAFVVVTVVGGDPDPDLPIRRPVYQVDCWATRIGSTIPPWGTANLVAEMIRSNIEARPVLYKRGLTFTDKGDYRSAFVNQARMRTEPRRAITSGIGDEASWAHYMTDVELEWIVTG